ncbi:MAG: Uma2 family endonuclease [Chloroflexi bacterium]|nr:Uma2 family endonuclease [Chloroflexota bacterium]
MKEYWLANPKTRTITDYFLPERGREYALLGEFAPGETIQSTIFLDLQLTTETLFVTQNALKENELDKLVTCYTCCLPNK